MYHPVRLVVLCLMLLTATSAASDPTNYLGHSISEYNFQSSNGPYSSFLQYRAIALRNTGDSLNLENLYARAKSLKAEDMLATRGARDIQIYQSIAPAVVLVLTDEGLGSGSILDKNGTILTNWHVVAGHNDVAVIFKPAVDGKTITKTDIYRAKVVRIDEVTDLALIQVLSPPVNLHTVGLGNDTEIQVGSDVHAIGHPTGQSWTYTKGIVSQLRQNFEWTSESNRLHHADIIQTQTPINPGNSGGPLLSDSGHIVGVNSFKATGEGLNFAVSIDEIKRFLATSTNRKAKLASNPTASASSSKKCETKVLANRRSKDNKAAEQVLDFHCDGKADGLVVTPDDVSQPIYLLVDTKGNGKFDTIYFDDDRDGKIDRSAYDLDGDGKPDIIGYHTNGDIKPYRYEPIVSGG